MNNQLALRQSFLTIKANYEAQGREVVTTPSDIRLEQILVQTTSQYTFPVLSSENNPAVTGGATNTEIRLNINDVFWAVLCGMYLALPASATDAEFILFSYPNPTKFTAAIAAPLNMFFNSSLLSITLNNVQYIQNFSTVRFRSVPITQNGLGATSSTTVPANVPSTTIDAFDGGDSGLTSLGTVLEISGQLKNTIVITAPTSMSVAPTAGTRLILYFRGFLSLNAAKR